MLWYNDFFCFASQLISEYQQNNCYDLFYWRSDSKVFKVVMILFCFVSDLISEYQKTNCSDLEKSTKYLLWFVPDLISEYQQYNCYDLFCFVLFQIWFLSINNIRKRPLTITIATTPTSLRRMTKHFFEWQQNLKMSTIKMITTFKKSIITTTTL